MTSSTGSDNNDLIEKSSSKDNKSTCINQKHTSSPIYHQFPGVNLAVDLPIDGPQLNPPPVSKEDDDEAPKGEPEKVLEDKSKKEAAAAKTEKQAQVERLARMLRQIFRDRPSTSSRKRLCDVFGDPSMPHKRPNSTANAAVKKEEIAVKKEEVVVKKEEVDEDNFAEAQVGEAAVESRSAVRDNVVPVVKYHCPDLNFLPPKEEDEDYYS